MWKFLKEIRDDDVDQDIKYRRHVAGAPQRRRSNPKRQRNDLHILKNKLKYEYNYDHVSVTDYLEFLYLIQKIKKKTNQNAELSISQQK